MPALLHSLAVLALLVQAPELDPLNGNAGSAKAATEDDEQAKLAAGAQDVISRRCAPCHAPGSDEVKALKAWGSADDLAATLSIEHMLKPGDPLASDLFLTIDDGDMPPPDWAGGQCTPAEVAVLRAWILAGAPAGSRPATVEASPGEQPLIRSPWRSWLGRLHPAVVHFPIGLLIAAVIADLLRRRPAACFCLCVGAIGAVLACALGWIAGEAVPGTKLEELDRHRWTGVAVAVYAALMAVVYPRLTGRDGAPRLLPRILLVVLLILVSLAGHWGGELTWGAGYLDLPW